MAREQLVWSDEQPMADLRNCARCAWLSSNVIGRTEAGSDCGQLADRLRLISAHYQSHAGEIDAALRRTVFFLGGLVLPSLGLALYLLARSA